jgi:ubiquinone/menaquinone biosynthesis C-methylase UbiE
MHGIDSSAGQLAYARERLAGQRAEFQQGDGIALPFEDDRTSWRWPEPARAVAEMTRVVRPGGTVVGL